MFRAAALLAVALYSSSAAAQLERCNAYRVELTRSARQTFGPAAPVADLAAQVHQESACDPNARSRVGALGLTQFMPLTATDMAARFPSVCAPANPRSPRWALRCRDRYMKSLLEANDHAQTESDQWAFALSAYNGGDTWRKRDQQMCRAAPIICEPCNPRRWWGHVEFTPDPRRAEWAVRENRGYPSRIMCVLAPRYESWGRSVGCPK